ncbi:MAG: FAD-binding oxidoreductase [Desulfurococcales archaeon]|nr:FAD-binding oxidoreductase [Desulfurococcales archaeon]
MGKCGIQALQRSLEALGLDTLIPATPRPGDLSDYDNWRSVADMWPLNIIRAYKGEALDLPSLVVYPESVEDVTHIVRLAASHKACIVPICGLSNVVGSTTPGECCVAVSLSRLDKILELREEDRLVVVEAGLKVSELEEWLNKRGFTLAYRPQSERLACIGGSISTLGAGAYSPGYGNIEDVVLWLDVVDRRGEMIRVGSDRNPRGLILPGVNNVFLGAEGGYGIIVRTGLRVRELPEEEADLSYTLPSFADAISVARRAYSWSTPLMMRIQDSSESLLHYGIEDTMLLARIAGPRSIVEGQRRYLEAIIRAAGGREAPGLVEKWWRNRLSYAGSVKTVLDMGLAFDTIDQAAYWSVLPRLHSLLLENLARIEGVSLAFSHASHFYPNGGSLYTTVVFERDPQVYWRVWDVATETALKAGASIVHHHGFGLLRRRWAAFEYGGSLKLACAVKRALDPGNLFNTRSSPASYCGGLVDGGRQA